MSEQRSSAGLRAELGRELQALQQADVRQCETTLLIHPLILTDFRDQMIFSTNVMSRWSSCDWLAHVSRVLFRMCPEIVR